MVVYQHWPRHKIDFGTSGVVFVLYPWGAGGKFVINSMAVSKTAMLQDADLARQQFTQQLSPQQKQHIVLTRLAAEHSRWQDLNFGVDNLTGVNERTYVCLSSDTAQYWPWTEVMHHLSKSDISWFIDVHDAGHLNAALGVWSGARIIKFVNTKKFLEWRRVNYNKKDLELFWNSIRDSSWPSTAPTTWQEFILLDEHIQRELVFVRHGDIFRYIVHPDAERCYQTAEKQQLDKVCAGRKVFEFDAECLLETDHYLNIMQDLYQWIELCDFDKSFLECYHKQWLEKIQQVPI